MPVKQHVHRYVRAVGRLTDKNKDSGFIDYYKCADPDCSHYQKADLILGKRSICNRCGKEFILPIGLRNLTNRPHCKNCTRTKCKISISKPVVLEAADEMEYEIVEEREGETR